MTKAIDIMKRGTEKILKWAAIIRKQETVRQTKRYVMTLGLCLAFFFVMLKFQSALLTQDYSGYSWIFTGGVYTYTSHFNVWLWVFDMGGSIIALITIVAVLAFSWIPTYVKPVKNNEEAERNEIDNEN